MTAQRTIPRHATRKIEALQAALRSCRIYTSDNGYSGVAVAPERAWESLARFERARLIACADGSYRIDVRPYPAYYVLSA